MEEKICEVVLKDKKIKSDEELYLENMHKPNQIKMDINPEETAKIVDREGQKFMLFNPNPFVSLHDYHNSCHSSLYINNHYQTPSLNNYALKKPKSGKQVSSQSYLKKIKIQKIKIFDKKQKKLYEGLGKD